MTYHFNTFRHGKESNISSDNVLEYLKTELAGYGKIRDLASIRAILNRYGGTLAEFTKHFRNLIIQAEKDAKLYKLFVTGLSILAYPLLVVLDIRGLLNRPLSTGDGRTYLDIFEALEIKVYKTCGRWPGKWTADIVYRLMDGQNVENELLNFIRRHSDDAGFRDSLRRNAYENPALVQIFIDYCEHLSGETYSVERLRQILKGGATKEHILSQTPDFNPVAFGFADMDDYENHLNSIGNMTLLESGLNSSIKNGSLFEKRKAYSESAFTMTKMLSAWLSEHKGFNKADMEKRAEELIEFCVKRWMLPHQ
jgi:hypothetical protein